MTERDEVLSVLKGEVIREKNRFGIRKIGIFGSVVRDEASGQSDLDILVEFDPEQVSYRKYLDLERYLQSLFPRKVEIVSTDGVSPYIMPYISREVIWA